MRLIRGTGLRGAWEEFIRASWWRMRMGKATEKSSGRCWESGGANWSSIWQTSNSLGGKTRPTPMPSSPAIECAGWCFRCWSGSLILRWSRVFAELAEIARDEEDYWENEISGWLGTVVQWSQPEWTRGLPGFGDSQSLVQIRRLSLTLDPELLTRLERARPGSDECFGEPAVAADRAAGCAEKSAQGDRRRGGDSAGVQAHRRNLAIRGRGRSGGQRVVAAPRLEDFAREPEAIVFVTPDLRRNERVPDYEYPLAVPGRVFGGGAGGSNRSVASSVRTVAGCGV